MIKVIIYISSLLSALYLPITHSAHLFAQESEKERLYSKETILNASNLLEIQFPIDAGILHEFWIPRNRSQNSKIILHIQDAHCHFEAQTNIAKLIESLMKRYNIHLVAVEGTAGPIDTSTLAEFKDTEVKEKIIKYYMKKGKITGAEYVSIMKKYPFSLVGIEDENLYEANLRAFKSLLPFRQESQIICDAITQALLDLKPKIYSDPLLKMDQAIEEYHSGKLTLRDFSKTLNQELLKLIKEEKLKEEFPNFSKLMESVQLEKGLNVLAQETENQKLQKKLNEILSKEKLSRLIAASLQVRLSRISQTRYYLILDEILETSKENPSISNWAKEFPETTKYIEYAKIYEDIHHKNLFEEIDALIEIILKGLFKNEDQKELFYHSQNISILKKLFLLEMSRKDLKYYQDRNNDFKSKGFIEFIDQKTKLYPVSNIDQIHNLAVENLDKYQPEAEQFYSAANRRDQILVDNTLKTMDEMNHPVAIMITGGYHTEGIKEILEEKNIAYALLSPKITEEEPDNPYVQILSEQKSTFEEFLLRVNEED
jgi:hypothetical protein